jgi:hypothetical protein
MNLRCAKACFGAPLKRIKIAKQELVDARAHSVAWKHRALNAKNERE